MNSTASHDEPLAVLCNPQGAPDRFRWRGRSYQVEAIDRIWRSGPRRSDGRRLYQMRSAGRVFLIAYDPARRSWSLARSPWRLRVRRAISDLALRWAA
ncbi:MAG: hypothetical protein K1X65_10030 [Caldilineales bacterium]|nr:hypothetical protein [Caldilineales bacterium]MCW5861174.1 hypothetical protein [Caldilineales bacterium]